MVLARVGIGTLMLLVPAHAAGQTVDEIVSKHIEARGGLDKIKDIQTLTITRTVATGIGSNVRVIIYRKPSESVSE